MDRGNAEYWRYVAGGIISLAAFTDEHRKAISADLIKCGYELEDVGHSLSWSALHSFIFNSGIESALGREINPELHDWSSTFKTNAILADIYDVLAMINANLVAIGSHSRTVMPKPYKRIGKQNGNGRQLGDGAVPVDELRAVFASKRKKRKENG